MQPTSREMQGPPSSHIPRALQNGHSHHIQQPQPQPLSHQFDHAAHDDFFDQMLCALPSWDLLSNSNHSTAATAPFDESILLASRLRQHQISGAGAGGPAKGVGLQLGQQQLVAPSELMPLPLSLGSGDSGREEIGAAFKASNPSGVHGLYNGFGGSVQPLQRRAQVGISNQQAFSHSQEGAHPSQNFGVPAVGTGQAQPSPAASGGAVAGTGAGPPRQRIRARRGQATDPHSIAERLRRERIAERMKALQEIVPNANKTDKASMLDEIIDYVKFLQLQVKVLSMSRLGGAAALAPLVSDIASDGPAGRSTAGNRATGSGIPSGEDDSLIVTEHQVAKLMGEDMGSAMQYLQGKGLCLMPISLASAISTARSSTSVASHINGSIMLQNQHPSLQHPNNVDGPSSPSVSVLTVQSAMTTNIVPEADGSRQPTKDATSVSKR